MGRKAILSDEQRKEHRRLANTKWRQANKERAKQCDKIWYEKNKDERNRKRREKRAREKVQRIQVVVGLNTEEISV